MAKRDDVKLRCGRAREAGRAAESRRAQPAVAEATLAVSAVAPRPRELESERRLTVGHRRGMADLQAQQSMPYLPLTGRWMELAGFPVGTKVHVQVEDKRLVLTPLAAGETSPCR